MKIDSIASQLLNNSALPKAAPVNMVGLGETKKEEFKSLLDTVGGIEKYQLEAKSTIYNSLVSGEGSTHNVVMAMQKAESQIKTASMVRDKLVQAYQEIMRVQL